MGIDRLKLAGAIKIFAFFAYFIYFYTFNSSLSYYIPSEKDGHSFKKDLINNKCLLLLGGSNVVLGLSSELLSKNSCEASNLGLNTEFRGFYNYSKWLGYDLKSKNIIYSSAIFYSTSLDDEESTSVKIPNISLFTILKNVLIDPRIKFSRRGDLINYKCNSYVESFEINSDEFLESNNIISKELNKRVSILRNLTNSENIYFRIPPIYVDNKKDFELYTYLIRQRIEHLKDFNIKIIGETMVSTDSSLFCDSFHPNAKGREAFTKEIVLKLK
jgi:hypothetical protein